MVIVMHKLPYLLAFSTFFFAQPHSVHAGNEPYQDSTEENCSSISRAPAFPNSEKYEAKWIPSAPFRGSKIQKKWEQMAQQHPHKYKIIGNTLWINASHS